MGASTYGAIALVCASRFPPAADGTYYHVLADRIARGLGYTWAWPDGAVTPAAHYPVGYPAIAALAYLVFGPHALAAMLVNAAFSAAAVGRAYVVVRTFASRRAAGAAALAMALHPALLPYVGALMTEGITAALLVIAISWVVSRRGRRWVRVALLSLTLGVATLIRPQCIVLAPLLGAAAGAPGVLRAVRTGLLALGLSLVVVLPWTVRNCQVMHQCALVSVNRGWNLLIGEQTRTGAWQPIDVPSECRTVWDEAEKDACFARAALRAIREHPWAWIRRVPSKLAVTFDYVGAAPWYLSESNPDAFGARAKWVLGAVETIVLRVTLLLVAAGLFRADRLQRRSRRGFVLGALIALSALTRPGYLAYLLIALWAPFALARSPARRLGVAASAVIGSTALVHGVFFGAGRYGLVVVPVVFLLALTRWGRAWRPTGASPEEATASSAKT